MAEIVSLTVEDGVAEIVVANPPVNALTHELRAALWDAFEKAEADAQVGAVVLRAEGRTFPAGADMREMPGPARAPVLGDLCRKVEDLSKPVLAAIHGTALGGGLELALACHYRIAAATAQLGLPEAVLGLIPSAGGTQRLPRIVGAGAALEILLSARPLTAAQAVRIGLVDKVIEGDLERAAFGSARNMAREGTAPRRSCDCDEGLRDSGAFLSAVRARRAALPPGPSAAREIVDCVEAALLLPFEAGLSREAVGFRDLADSDVSRALRHVFLAERHAGRSPGGIRPKPLRKIGIFGGGDSGTQLALAALAAGQSVVLVEPDPAALDRAEARIEGSLEAAVKAGALKPVVRDERLAQFTAAVEVAALAPADLVVEALADAGARVGALTLMRAILRPDCIVAVGAPGDGLAPLAEALGRADGLLSLSLALPIDKHRLVEMTPASGASGASAGGQALSSLHALMRRLGRVPIVTGGPLADALYGAGLRAAQGLLMRGASLGGIDAALSGFGLPLGPFRRLDALGLDRLGPDLRSVLTERLVARGWTGRAVGQGFYRYDGEAPVVAPEAEAMIAELGGAGHDRLTLVSEREIVERVWLAMANEGARLVTRGIAASPEDVDLAAVHGFGFPRNMGGPMQMADRRGLLTTMNRLKSWAAEDKAWTPDPLWAESVKTGRHFAEPGGAF